MTATSEALAELRAYCDIAVRHSYDQYAKHGTLHEKAEVAFADDTVWDHAWVPWDFDLCDAQSHPVWHEVFTHRHRLAWNHFEWTLNYSAVAQGERQIIVLNDFAVRGYADVMPSVVELERRESYEETDHVAAFTMVIDAVRDRYMPGAKPVWSKPASGLGNETANRVIRRGLGVLANHLLGSNFPTLYFLARGMKTHGFKPFENAIAQYEEGHPSMRMISHLHRLDESRHMATSLNLARLSTQVLDTLPRDNRHLFSAAVQAAFPHGRSADYRLDFWKRVLRTAQVFADVPAEQREDLLRHMQARTPAKLAELHQVQTRLTRQANKRIIEESGLSAPMKRLFVEIMRKDPAYACIVDAVRLPDDA